MVAAMAMFRKRLMRDPSHYPNQRIAFLDQDLISSMVKDFKQFADGRKNFLFRQFYVDHFNGTYPIGSATNKKWYVEVDHLYGCLFVNKNHWVALDINLPQKKIYVYDSISSLCTDKEILDHCMCLRQMIPALLSVLIPAHIRKKTYAKLDVKRVTKNVPQNEDPGDCGVYAIKYIECLALKKSFAGICDQNIQALRVKLAAELFDEVGESGPQMSEPLPRGNDDAFKIPHLTDSL